MRLNFVPEITRNKQRHLVVVTTTIRLRFDRRSTPIRLQSDRATTVERYGLSVLSCCTGGLHKYRNVNK